MEDYRRILIVQTAFLGDVILTFPLVEAVHSLWPEAEIDFLAHSVYVDFLKTHKRIHRVIPYAKRGSQSGTVGMLKLVRELRRSRYELVLIPHRSFRSGLLAFLAGIRQRVGFKRVAGCIWYTDRVKRHIDQHEGRRNLELLSPFSDVEATDWDIRPWLDLDGSQARDEIDAWMESVGFSRDAKFIALAPGSVWATKRWPYQHWHALLQQITSEDVRKVALIGGPEDRDLCLRVRDVLSGGVFIAAGELSVQGSAALIERADLLITGDSAPLHLAQAVRTPTLAIFGPTVPEFGFAPTGQHDRVVGLELACRPCAIHGSQECPLQHHDCMNKLSSDKVWSTAREILAISSLAQ